MKGVNDHLENYQHCVMRSNAKENTWPGPFLKIQDLRLFRGCGLYYAHDKEGATNVTYVSLSGKRRDITTGPQSLFPSSVSDDGIAVGTRTTADRPEDMVRFDLATGRDMQWLAAFLTFDGLRVSAHLLTYLPH